MESLTFKCLKLLILDLIVVEGTQVCLVEVEGLVVFHLFFDPENLGDGL